MLKYCSRCNKWIQSEFFISHKQNHKISIKINEYFESQRGKLYPPLMFANQQVGEK